MLSTQLLLAATLALLVALSAAQVPSQYTESVVLRANLVTLYWIPVGPTDTTISFALVGTTTGSVAVGWNPTTLSMPGSDAVVAWMAANGTAFCGAYAMNGYTDPEIVASSSLTIADCTVTEVAGVTTALFTRPMAAGLAPIVRNTPVTVFGAVQNDDSVAYHGLNVTNTIVRMTIGTPSIPTPVTQVTTLYCWSYPCVPQPGVISSATCQADFCFDWSSRTLSWSITHNVVLPTVSHIHDSQGIVFGIAPVASPMFGQKLLTATQDDKVCSGNSYWNIHSDEYPTGELMVCLNIDCSTGDKLSFNTCGDIPVPAATPRPPTPGPQPIDCVLSAWSNFGPCSKPCDGGVYTRNRTVVSAPANGGIGCGATSQTAACNDLPCPTSSSPPQDCRVSAWSSWSTCACSSTSTDGSRGRTRNIVATPSNGGAACPTDMNLSEPCTCPCTPTRAGCSNIDTSSASALQVALAFMLLAALAFLF